MTSSTRSDRTAQFRKDFLRSTLLNCVTHSSYYRNQFGDAYLDVDLVSDLAVLPISDKTTLTAQVPNIVYPPRVDDVMSMTSGTTGVPFLVRRSPGELHEIQRLFSTMRDNSELNSSLVLEIADDFHGAGTKGSESGAIRVPFSQPAHGHWIINLLGSEFESPQGMKRIGVIQGLLGHVQALTLFLIQSGVDPGIFNVRDIATTGYFLTSAWRAFLERSWRAKIVDTYSLSEFAGNGAVECELCGCLHFIAPTIVGEVVDVFTRTPISPTEGQIGGLVLTGLVPFYQRQPLIRYWTGDLVEFGPTCSWDDFGFKFRGRAAHSIVWQKQGQSLGVLLEGDIAEVLSDIPELYRPLVPKIMRPIDPVLARLIPEPPYPIQSRLVESTRVEQHNQVRLELDISLSYIPEFYPERVADLQHSVRHQMLQLNPTLSDLVSSGDLHFELRFAGPHEVK